MVFLITGIVFIFCGFILFKFPPDSINSMIGYRTPMAMKNKDTWDEAQKYGGKSMVVVGIITMLLWVLSYLIKGFLLSETFQLLVLILCAVIMIVADEIHLWRTFNRDGSRK